MAAGTVVSSLLIPWKMRRQQAEHEGGDAVGEPADSVGAAEAAQPVGVAASEQAA